MIKRFLLVTTLLFTSLCLRAHQIDEAAHYYTKIKSITTADRFCTDSLRSVANQLSCTSTHYLKELFSQLSLECVRQSDEETGYYTSLMAAVCFFDREMFNEAMQYVNDAISFNHNVERQPYLHFLKGKFFFGT